MQMQKIIDDIVAPLRTLGQNVSANLHCREQEQPCYDLTFFSLKEEQANEIVRLLARKELPPNQ
jgi:hypothetical protein